MQKITPFLWFDNQAEEAAKFYTSIFPNSRILSFSRYDKEGAKVSGMPEGTAMTVAFQLDGQDFTALNGGPIFKFNESISFVVHCKSQKEVDYYWERLARDPNDGQCGWLKDKYGISWQVVPEDLSKYIAGPDKAKAERAMKAMLSMKKLDIYKIKDAYEGKVT